MSPETTESERDVNRYIFLLVGKQCNILFRITEQLNVKFHPDSKSIVLIGAFTQILYNFQILILEYFHFLQLYTLTPLYYI